jgi:cobalt-zinc-cadmium efflux system outer membrane protein
MGRVSRDRGNAERRRAEAFADLHLLLSLDPLETVTLQEEQVSDEPVPGPAELVQEALANRGEMKASRRALDAAKAEARLASREWIPSPRIGVSSSHEQESNATIVQGVVSFDLPLFNRNKAARGVAASRVAQSETALEATDLRIRQEVLTALARVQAARSAADGYASDVVRAMQENMELVTESYRAGKIDFLQLLVIRRQTLEARREYIDVLEELNAARAQLNRAVGRIP